MTEEFKDYFYTVVKALNKFKVEYTLFGGAVICLYNEERVTEDLDISVNTELSNVDRFIAALVSIEFGTEESIREQIFGDDTNLMYEDTDEYTAEDIEEDDAELRYTYHVDPTKSDWETFHIDLMFSIGEWNYNNIKSEVSNIDGELVKTATLKQIAIMKKNIYPLRRDKDNDDIDFIIERLGLDQTTDKPIVKKVNKPHKSIKKSIKAKFIRGDKDEHS
jgi:hypothetical protein